jgi:arylsulfatase
LGEKERADDPFFLYLAYNAPHWPLHAHPYDIAKYKGVYDSGYEAIRKARYERQLAIGLFDEAVTPLSEPEHKPWTTLSPKERDEEALRMQIHAAMVDRLDQNIGRLLGKLRELGKQENTLIIFLVDNGASHERPKRGKKDAVATWGSVGSFEAIGQSWANATNSPFKKWKVQGMEGGICTPMIAHWPNGIKVPKNSISREPCHLIDFVPTFIELAGERSVYPENLPDLDGISLTPTFAGKKLTRETPLFFQYGSWQVIREDSWKLVQHKSDPWQLYDLSRDRTETRNLASAFPERVLQMMTRWKDWAKEVDLKGKFQKSKKKPTKNK